VGGGSPAALELERSGKRWRSSNRIALASVYQVFGPSPLYTPNAGGGPTCCRGPLDSRGTIYVQVVDGKRVEAIDRLDPFG
jgi:hypothetical protein